MVWHNLIVQKMAAVESASSEERERLRSTYRVRLKDMDTRLKVSARSGVHRPTLEGDAVFAQYLSQLHASPIFVNCRAHAALE